MINDTDIIRTFEEELFSRIGRRGRIPTFQPLATTEWVAMSMLQKAIRRGHVAFALQAAATLLVNAPHRLWRRCGGIAFEDIGIAHLDTVGLVTACLGSKRLRALLGGEWSVASFIVEEMAVAPKCRAADDLLMSIELHPNLANARQNLPELTNDELRHFTQGAHPLQERAAALWYLLGTDRRPSKHMTTRRGDPGFVFDLLIELGAPFTITTLAKEGYRYTREALCPFVGLLTVIGKSPDSAIEDDVMPPDTMIGPVPSWAIDQYTREGRAALGRLLRTGCRTAQKLCSQVPHRDRLDTLGGLVFRAEGGLLSKRLRWSLGDELRLQVDKECHGLDPVAAAELLDLLRGDLPLLNRVRKELIGGMAHGV